MGKQHTGTQLPCFTSTKIKTLTPEELAWQLASSSPPLVHLKHLQHLPPGKSCTPVTTACQQKKRTRNTLSLVCDTRTVAHFTLEQLLDYFFTFFYSEKCTTYPRTSFRIVPKCCIASEPRTARPLGVFWGHRDSKFSENSLQALTRFKLSAVPTTIAQLRQYLYFCTSKASKLTTWNYLPSTGALRRRVEY